MIGRLIEWAERLDQLGAVISCYEGNLKAIKNQRHDDPPRKSRDES